MGACYSVSLKVKTKNEEKAIKSLRNKIDTDRNVNYNLKKLCEEGESIDAFNDLIGIFLAGGDSQELNIETDNNFITYQNDFDAPYGWERVMIEMFQTISPFLEDGSKFLIYIDNDYDEFIIKKRKCIQLH